MGPTRSAFSIRSRHGGLWSASNTGLTNLSVSGLALDPLTPTTLYAGTNGGGIFAITFTPEQLLLTVSQGGPGSGTVTSRPAGISCGTTCSATFDFGTRVTLTATAARDSAFTGWRGEGCSGTGTCTVSMTQARSVTATFALAPTSSGGGGCTLRPGSPVNDLDLTLVSLLGLRALWRSLDRRRRRRGHEGGAPRPVSRRA